MNFSFIGKPGMVITLPHKSVMNPHRHKSFSSLTGTSNWVGAPLTCASVEIDSGVLAKHTDRLLYPCWLNSASCCLAKGVWNTCCAMTRPRRLPSALLRLLRLIKWFKVAPCFHKHWPRQANNVAHLLRLYQKGFADFNDHIRVKVDDQLFQCV